MLPGHLGPLGPRLLGGLDGHVDFLLAGLVVGGEDMLVVEGADGLGRITRAHLFAPDDQGDLDLLREHPL